MAAARNRYRERERQRETKMDRDREKEGESASPASRSVRAKHPSVPSACMRSNAARCAGPPSSSTVPAKRLYSTVKRMLNPGPCSNPWLTNSLS